MNSNYKELSKEIKEIKNNEFNINTLRRIQLLNKNIENYFNTNKISNNERLTLEIKLEKLIFNKMSEISNNKKLAKMLKPLFELNYNKVPTDITIVDNNLALLYNESFTEPLVSEYMPLNSKQYTELTEQHGLYQFIKTYENIFWKYKDETFRYFYNFYFPNNTDFTNNHPSLQNIITNINNLLKEYISTNEYQYTKNTIEYNFYTNRITYQNNIRIFTDKTLKDIITAIFKNKQINFNLIAVNDWNEIYCFKITQNSLPDKTFTWDIKPTNLNIWNLSQELKTKKLTKKIS